MAASPRVVIAGGSGFLGRTLTKAAASAGYDVVVLTRRLAPSPGDRAPRAVHWTPDGKTGPWAEVLDGATAVVNLAGESIGEGRWTEARKEQLRSSRFDATRSLVAAIHACRTPPAVFVSGSAVGYYGSRGDEILTEESSPGNDFLARLCVEWEQVAAQAAAATRVVLVRTGLVLDAKEGALPRMLTPIKLLVGGPIGSGRQYMSWIHREDWAALVLWAIEEKRASGPLNATTNNPATNGDFTRAAAAELHRPAIMPVPAFAVRLLTGEMGDALVVGGQRVVPRRALDLGFRFRYPELRAALADILA
jgi:uncharacterized protein (TIGR01777 family)